MTSVDPPELVVFIKKYHPDVEREIPRDKDGKPITMWNLISKKGMLPTRLARYCCEKLKESGGDGYMTITGVRWAESVNRSQNQGRLTLADKAAGREFANNPNFGETVRGGGINQRQRGEPQTDRILLQTAQNARKPHYRLDGRGSMGIHQVGGNTVLLALRRGISKARLHRLSDGSSERTNKGVCAVAEIRTGISPRNRANAEGARTKRIAERRSVFKRRAVLCVVDGRSQLRGANDVI